MPISRIKSSAINNDSVTSAKIDDGTIVAVDIADDAVTTAKLNGLTGSSSGIIKADGDGTMSVTTADLVDDTTPQLGGDLDGNGNTIDLTANTESMGVPRGTSAQAPTASITEGHIRYNNDDNSIYFSDGNNWQKISAAVVTLSSVTGTLYSGNSSTLTLAGEGFLTSNLVVNFIQSSDGIDEDVTVTPSSDTAATVTVPSAVYNSVTAGNVVTIKVTNSDGSISENQTTTATALPSGGTVTTSGNYRIHTFTSSGTFTNTVSNLSVEYLVIAGGGSGGIADTGAVAYGGGGGAGGYRTNVSGQTSGGSSSAEGSLTLTTGNKTVTVGAGGASVSSGSNATGLQGSNSVFDSITSIGGGGGGGNTVEGQSGGSGGGGMESDGTGRSGTAGQGTSGGPGSEPANRGGGGGGAGTAGGTTNGGNGLNSNITGSTVTRAGGGGSNSSGGTGGGGNAGNPAQAGDTNKGSGGGAGYATTGAGGSGIVIVRYDTTAI